jgi:hypothetical protein
VSPSRGPVAAGALLGALAVAGCGLGAGGAVGGVELTVTRDYGEVQLQGSSDGEVAESETVIRLLDRNAEITTRYGGGFVQSIDGLEGASEDGRRLDWFFYVNGLWSPVGAAEYELRDGYRVWWDYRDWTAAMQVPAVVGSFPEPFRSGYEGERHPVRVLCFAARRACGLVRDRIEAEDEGGEGEPIRVLVGPWARVRSDAAAASIARGPTHSGVFAEFRPRAGRWRLQPLDYAGEPAGPARAAGLVAATRAGDQPPTWLVTGTDSARTVAAARLLDEDKLRNLYAVATGPIPLPVR